MVLLTRAAVLLLVPIGLFGQESAADEQPERAQSVAERQEEAKPHGPGKEEQEELTAAVPPEVLSQPAFYDRNRRYAISASDSLTLTFAHAPEFNQKVTVQPDGFVTLLEIGEMHIQGLTVPEVTEKVRAAYAKILAEPVVSVVLSEFEKPYFTAGGELQNPGRYDIRGATTIVEAVIMAGGFNDRAKHSNVLLFRRVSADHVDVRKIDVKGMLTANGSREDIYLQPGDVIYVPQSRMSKVRDWLRLSSPSVRVP